MSRVTLRDATLSDFEAICGGPPDWRCRAFTAELDGNPIGIGGFANLPDGTWAAFVHVTEGARRFKVAMHKAGLRAMEEAKRMKLRRVVALAEPGVEPAARWLERLGFRPIVINQDTVWVWTNK